MADDENRKVKDSNPEETPEKPEGGPETPNEGKGKGAKTGGSGGAKKEGSGKKGKKVKIVDEKPRSLRKRKPELPEDVKAMLELRRERKKKEPKFRRQEWSRYKKLGEKWRRPKGLHSKMRINKRYRPPRVRVGYGSPSLARGLHPSGFREVLVHNPADLNRIDPKVEAARIAHGVGTKKREAIIAAAEKKKIRVLNGGG
ncbi:MAG: 50S ribosomal protein L32e [Thermoplasmata archaeon]|nr:50S ribosomal protein L32e [Thermoplasmata archaeon]